MAVKKTNRVDIYDIVTQKILDKLENGTVPWQKPWNVKTGAPCNLVTGKPYNGINVMLLGSQAYDSKYWLTFKQCSDNGGHVQKGEHGSMVVFWNFVDKKTSTTSDSAESGGKDTETVEQIPMLRFYTVFNANQCADLDVKRLTDEIANRGLEQDTTTVIPAQEIMDQYVDAPVIKHGYTRACYRPLDDEINMPKMEHFKSPNEYFATLFHEAIHSTGRETRLNRRDSSEIRVFGDCDYSKEELVAEMGAAFLCVQAGIDTTLDNSAAYIKSWMKALQDDKKLLITAAGQAQKAAAYISEGLGREKTVEVAMLPPEIDAKIGVAVASPLFASTTAQDIQKAVDDGRIPAELVATLKGPNFEYSDEELMSVIIDLAENPNGELLAQYIVSGTIGTREVLDGMTKPLKAVKQMSLGF